MAMKRCKQCQQEYKKGLFEKAPAKDQGFCSMECLKEFIKVINAKREAAKEAEAKVVKEAKTKAAKEGEWQQRKLNDLRSDFTVFKGQADEAYYTGDYAQAQKMYTLAHKIGAELVKVDPDYERRTDDVKDLFEIFNASDDGEKIAKIKERANYVMIRLDANFDEAVAGYKYGLTIAPDDSELQAGLKKAELKKAAAAGSDN
jgi:hypothetical protein